MDFGSALKRLFEGFGGQQQQARPQQPAHQKNTRPSNDPASQGFAPDITYNPNPNTNIPYSTHNRADVALGNQYTADPTNKRFLGVDPARFGYPADDTAQTPFKMYEDNSFSAPSQTRNVDDILNRFRLPRL